MILVVTGLLSLAVGPCRHASELTPVSSVARLYYDDRPAAAEFRDSLRSVVQDGLTWRDQWAKATSGQPSRPELPEVDFDHEMVLIVAAGRLSAGDQIHVDSVGVRGKYFVAVVRTILECQAFPANAYPLEIVRVARSKKQVSFIEHRERAAHCQ